jgi:hypothetical protein
MFGSNPQVTWRIVAAAFPPPASMNLLPLPFFDGFDQRHTHFAFTGWTSFRLWARQKGESGRLAALRRY